MLFGGCFVACCWALTLALDICPSCFVKATYDSSVREVLSEHYTVNLTGNMSGISTAPVLPRWTPSIPRRSTLGRAWICTSRLTSTGGYMPHSRPSIIDLSPGHWEQVWNTPANSLKGMVPESGASMLGRNRAPDNSGHSGV